jgi:Tfp pilus assembly protein PilF
MSTADETATSPLERPCPFITFYSFKGGVGRSMALINVAGILAARGFRVLVLDMDLEAPGISYLASEGDADRARHQPGLVDLLLDATERGPEGELFASPPDQAIGRYCAPYELPEAFRRGPDAALSIMPAGRLDRGYAGRLERLDLPGLYREGHGLGVMLAFKQVVQDSKRFDYVFVDSRTGFSDESGICTRDLADYIVVLSGLNKQNIEGTAAFLKALRAATQGEREVEVVLSPVPNGEDALVDERAAIAQSAFTDAWGSPLACDLQIPYHPQLALTEEPHIFRRRRGHLYDAYVALERRVRRLTGDTPEALADAALERYKARRFDAALARLQRAALLDDSSSALDQFTVNIGNIVTFDPDVAPLYEFLRTRASEGARITLANGARGEAQNLARKLRLDEAERAFNLALHIAPNHAASLGRYADFLWYERKDYDAAEVMYQRAMEADPYEIITLGNYANFRFQERKDLDAAEVMYRRSLAIDPDNAITLANYARLLWIGRKDLDAAEAMFKDTLQIAPNHADTLGSYANLLWIERKDRAAADAMYKRSLDAAPRDADTLGNYAAFLLACGQLAEGLDQVERALSLCDPARPRVIEAECWMYLYCCAPAQRRAYALTRLHRLITTDHITTGDWSFAGVITQAVKMGHPEAAQLPALAEVLAGRQPPSALEAWPAWRATRSADVDRPTAR